MELPLIAHFTSIGAGDKIRGEIRFSNEGDLKLWTHWRYRPTDGDLDWDWGSILQESMREPSSYECYSAFTDGCLEGLVSLDLKMKREEIGNPITIDYLASDPANRPPAGKLKHVGAALMALAILRSREVGAEGALWLESLPGAEPFYGNLGMVQQPIPSDHGYHVYVLSPSNANRLLAQIVGKGILEL